MTKAETIKNHYIQEFINSGMLEQEAEQKWDEISEFVDDNGWIVIYENNPFTNTLYVDRRNLAIELVFDYKTKSNGNFKEMRPTSLRGIETNNSWIRIESEKDLPSEDCDVFLYFKDGEIMCDRFLLNYKNFATINYIHVSHYQPITKPLQPLH